MPLFDTHCHLGLDGEDEPAAVHTRARAAGVEAMVLVGIDLDSSRRARALAGELPGVLWSAGLHPNESADFAGQWQDIASLAAVADCIAIGETGMDFHWQRATAGEQEHSLRHHLELARDLRKPVILHCRDAFPALFAILEDFAGTVRGVMHCFNGGVEEARRSLDLGYHLSFAGPLTYPRNDALRTAAAFAPAESLLVETDAPFLPPQSRRGKRNEPAFLGETLTTLATVRGWSQEQAARVTWDNAQRLFRPAALDQRPGPAP